MLLQDSADFVFTRDRKDYVRRHNDQVYFWWAEEGQGHHVYDVAIVNGYVRKVPYESRRATYRVFVVPAGHQWRYRLTANDLRTITVGELGRQRAAAVYHPGKNQHGANSRMTT